MYNIIMKISKQTKAKMSIVKLGKSRPDMIGNTYAKGPMSNEHKEKIRAALKGKAPKNIKQVAGWNKGKKAPWASGESNYNWAGDKVGYRALHNWVEKRLGKPMVCAECGDDSRKRYHWANISSEYKRDITDWIRLCPPCHKKKDVRKSKLQCKHGHDFSETAKFDKKGWRYCRRCRLKNYANYHLRQKTVTEIST